MPKPAALAIIFSPDQNKVLLVKRRDVPVWVLPGGGIEAGESAADAAVRETFEETGLNVILTRQSGDYSPINCLAAPTSVFVGQVVSGELKVTAETAESCFFDLNYIPKEFFSVHADWLNDARQNSQMVKKKLTQITYWGVLKFALQHPYWLLRFMITRITQKN